MNKEDDLINILTEEDVLDYLARHPNEIPPSRPILKSKITKSKTNSNKVESKQNELNSELNNELNEKAKSKLESLDIEKREIQAKKRANKKKVIEEVVQEEPKEELVQEEPKKPKIQVKKSKEQAKEEPKKKLKDQGERGFAQPKKAKKQVRVIVEQSSSDSDDYAQIESDTNSESSEEPIIYIQKTKKKSKQLPVTKAKEEPKTASIEKPSFLFKFI
jgi:hypothetical protein